MIWNKVGGVCIPVHIPALLQSKGHALPLDTRAGVILILKPLYSPLQQGQAGENRQQSPFLLHLCRGLEQFLCFNQPVPFTLTLTSQLSRA